MTRLRSIAPQGRRPVTSQLPAIPARDRQRREFREDIANYLRDAAPMKARLATARNLEAFWRLTLAGRTRAAGFPKR